ncbi:cytochrome P460 family protein [Pelagicoccus sp. SDUM812005]|uniref:cytochrome P460 family protein n=1 Tax=Pelagicoccus sp. SDUM812005 TaxID=3041257 RepID=UPI00280E89EB|nr:cytochrome P460 family protein [Pelagicoccus sp. SDUM812005]MDQ8182821.1 cytochrome P460 family protein [Pelagicoccus sp. SDUM812005]
MSKGKLTLFALPIASFSIWLWGGTPEELAPKGDQQVPFTTPSDFVLPASIEGIPLDYRDSWARITGFEFSGLHWNHFVVVYVNKGADIYNENYFEYVNTFVEDDWGAEESEDEDAEFKAYEQGTIFLKEHYTANGGKPTDTSFVTLMEKKEPGYDPEFGDWRYVWIDGRSGEILQDGNSKNEVLNKSCIECHANMADRDFVFATASRAGH